MLDGLGLWDRRGGQLQNQGQTSSFPPAGSGPAPLSALFNWVRSEWCHDSIVSAVYHLYIRQGCTQCKQAHCCSGVSCGKVICGKGAN